MKTQKKRQQFVIELNDRIRGHLILEISASISEYFTELTFQSDGQNYTYAMKEKSKRNFKLFALDLHLGNDHIKHRIEPRTRPEKSLAILAFLQFIKILYLLVHSFFLAVFSPHKLQQVFFFFFFTFLKNYQLEAVK